MEQIRKRRECDIKKLTDYKNYLRSNKFDQVGDTDELYKKYKNAQGEEKIRIRNEIVEKNLPLVLNFIIKKYNYSYDVNPVFDLDDVIQEGNLILLEAINSFNPEKGSLSTYIYKLLYNNIYYVNGIPNSAFKVNRGVADRYKQLKKYIDLGYDDEYIMSHFPITDNMLKILRPVLTDVISYQQLEKRLSEEHLQKKMEMENSIPDLEYGRILEEENINKRNATIRQVLNKLKKKERMLLVYKFGLDGTMPMTTKEANKFVGYSENYLRDKYRRLRQKLAKNPDLKNVYDLVDVDYDYDIPSKTYYLNK